MLGPKIRGILYTIPMKWRRFFAASAFSILTWSSCRAPNVWGVAMLLTLQRTRDRIQRLSTNTKEWLCTLFCYQKYLKMSWNSQLAHISMLISKGFHKFIPKSGRKSTSKPRYAYDHATSAFFYEYAIHCNKDEILCRTPYLHFGTNLAVFWS